MKILVQKSSQIFLFCLVGILTGHCKRKELLGSSLFDSIGDFPKSRIENLSISEKAKFFAAISDAVYCGDGTQCSILDQYNRTRNFLNVSFDLSDWKMEFTSARDSGKDIEGYVFYHPNFDDVIIGFRGSEDLTQNGSIQDWISTNALVLPGYYAGPKISGNVHQGFLNAMYGIWHPNSTGLIKIFSDHQLWDKKFWITGHSLGGNIANLVGMRLFEENKIVAGIFTYGTPKLAFWNFQYSFNQALQNVTYQYVTESDPVPRSLPNFVAVGNNFVLKEGVQQPTDKDGPPNWDLVTILLSADLNAHRLDSKIANGYLNSLRKIP